MTETAPHRRRLDQLPPVAPEPEWPGPATPLQRFAVGIGVWVLPLVNTVLLLIVLLR